MLTKDFAVTVKAVAGDPGSDLETGQFEAIVSAFGNVDSVGDVVVKGAFADDLKRWKDSGDPIPIVWAHKWEDPFAHIGYVLEAKEADEGLWIKGQVDLDGENPTAMQVNRLLKGRRVKQFSFAYDVLEGESVTKDDSSFFELRKLKVYEVGPCLVGANQETTLLAAKAAQLVQSAKAGRVLSAKNLDGLKAARDAINEVIASQEGDEEKADEATNMKTSEADQAEDGNDGLSQSDGSTSLKELDPEDARQRRNRKTLIALTRKA